MIPKVLKPKETQDIRIHLYGLALAGGLVGLAIVLIKTIDPTKTVDPTYTTLIIVLLVLIFLTLFIGLFGFSIYKKLKNYYKKRKQDKLARTNFPLFSNLIARFDFVTDKDDNIHKVIKDLKPHTETDSTMPFGKLCIPDINLVLDIYNLFIDRLNQFDGTIDDFILLAKEFESIQKMYFRLYIDFLIQQIIDGKTVDKVPKHRKEYFNNARQKYISYMREYNKYGIEMNNIFKNDIFSTYFDYPKEL